MTPSKIKTPIPRITLTLAEAAAALGMGYSSFERHVRPHVRVIREGKLVLVPVPELERWAAENADWTIGPAA